MSGILDLAPRPVSLDQLSAFRLEREGDLGIVWFDLPGEKVNKLSSAVMVELDGLVELIGGMSDLRVVVFASGKRNIFIAGADINEFTRVTSAEQAEEFTRYGQRVFMKVARLPQITVAAIHGACMGGGTELALNCDYRVISDDAKSSLALPEVKLGIVPAWTGTTRLPRLIGIAAALDMILTGRTVDPRRAKKIGLIDEVLPSGSFISQVKQFSGGQRVKRRRSENRMRLIVERNPLARKIVFAQARKSVAQKTGRNYPAPFAAIDVMEQGFSRGFDAGLAAEAREASRLITGAVAQNLVRLFFLVEDAKKQHAGAEPLDVRRAGVLGAGLMGGGIAQLIADKTETSVRLKDIDWNALSSGLGAAAKVWRKKVERGGISKSEMARKLSRISTTTDWSGFSSVDLVVEAVIEKLEVKQEVLREFESLSRPDAIFATNTSTIPISRIAAAASRPENVAGMHFFSPVDRMPLVEVIRGHRSSDRTVATVAAFARKLGKTVVVCGDGPGFIVNRILGPYINEAGLLVEEGFAIETIDRAITNFGMPLGPLALLDEVGIDVAGKAAEVMQQAFSSRVQPSRLIEVLLADGRFGKKNGRGVYRWKKGKRSEPDPKVYRLLGGAARRESRPVDHLVERMVLAMINEAARVLDEKIARSAADIDLAMILGTGFPPFRGGLLRHADTLGVPYVVARLSDLETRYGSRFAPSEPLRRLAGRGETFTDALPGSKLS